MPRRYGDYLFDDGFTALNTMSTIFSFLLGASTLPFMYNVWRTAKRAPKVTVDDPWGYGNSLEWATSCPPPRHNFVSIPRIRSERPAFDLHHPEVVRVDQPEPNKNLLDQVLGEPDLSNRNDAGGGPGGQGGTASGTGSEGSVR
jgi:cytochrome c oxidase subunit 1